MVHYWPGFTSSTKVKDVAVTRSRDDNEFNAALIFEIYINDKPDSGIITNIDTSCNMGGLQWSDYPAEKEVLILPNFCFTVLDISEYVSENMTIVRVAEIPYQHAFALRPVSLTKVLWIDPFIMDNEENEGYSNHFEQKFRNNQIDFSVCEDIDAGIEITKDAVNTIIIAGCNIGQTLMEKIE